MKVELDISKNLKCQFDYLVDQNKVDLQGIYGDEKIDLIVFPDKLELYHFKAVEQSIPIEMNSINPFESEWYLLHVNIGTDKQVKTIGGERIDFHRFLPSGILMYCPGLEIQTNFPAGHQSELVSFRFNKTFLNAYFEDNLIPEGQLLLYEDLDFTTEKSIMQAIANIDNKLKCHAITLDVLNRIFEKIKTHHSYRNSNKVHKDDITNLFIATGHLTDPLAKDVPSVNKLASIAGMSPSKFKRLFNQVYGRPPHQFHFKLKMEYAKDELNLGQKSPTELSDLLGYSHPSNFTSAFKKYFKVLPSQEFGKGRSLSTSF